MSHGLEVETFQQVQVLQHDRALAPEADFVYVHATIVGGKRLLDSGVKSGEVRFAQQASCLFAEFADAVGDRPAIKMSPHRLDASLPTVTSSAMFRFRHLLKCPRQVRLRKNLSYLCRVTVR